VLKLLVNILSVALACEVDILVDQFESNLGINLKYLYNRSRL